LGDKDKSKKKRSFAQHGMLLAKPVSLMLINQEPKPESGKQSLALN
jgi:hypothetical protein